MPKSGSSEPEGQPAEGNLRSGACQKAEAVSPKANPPSSNLRSGRQKNQLAEGNPEAAHAESRSREPEGQPAEGNSEAEGYPERRKPPEPRAVKPAGRSRETRGRRSSADTPTNTIEKRDCDTLRPSEAS